MYRKILIATDGTELASKAVKHGVALAKAFNVPVVIATVTEMWSAMEMAKEAQGKGAQALARTIEQFEALAADHARKILADAEKQAEAVNLAHETRHISDARPSDGILMAAKEAGCDLIVMSTHGRRGLDRLVLGSVATEVLTHTTIPVLIVR